MSASYLDFPVSEIRINSGSDKWGPFSFDLSRSLPPGDVISSVTVASSTESGTDTTANLIEPDSTTHTATAVGIRLQYPGPELTGRHFLQFAVTLASGAMHRFTFGYVVVSA